MKETETQSTTAMQLMTAALPFEFLWHTVPHSAGSFDQKQFRVWSVVQTTASDQRSLSTWLYLTKLRDAQVARDSGEARNKTTTRLRILSSKYCRACFRRLLCTPPTVLISSQ